MTQGRAAAPCAWAGLGGSAWATVSELIARKFAVALADVLRHKRTDKLRRVHVLITRNVLKGSEVFFSQLDRQNFGLLRHRLHLLTYQNG